MNNTIQNHSRITIEAIVQDGYKALHLIHRQLVRIEPNADTTHHDLATLAMVSQEKAIPVTEIARRLSIPKSHMTQILDRLVEQGLVSRILDDTDRRRFLVSITDTGRKRLREYKKAVETVLEDKLSVLTETEVATLAKSLRNVVKITQKLS